VCQMEVRVTGLVQPPAFLRPLGPRYLALWASQTIAQLADAIAIFSIPLLISYIQQTDVATLDFSLTYAIQTAPVFLIGMFGGVLLDRWHLRPVLITTNLLRACAFFYLAGSVGSPNLGIGTVFALAFVIGTMSTMFDGALYSMLPRLVRKDRLADANSLVSVSIQVNDAVGPFFAGVLAATFGSPAVGLFLTGVLFTMGAATMKWVGPVPRHQIAPEDRKPFLTEATNGIKYLWAEDRLRITTITAGLANFVVGFIEGTFRVLYMVVLEAPSETAKGLLLAAVGVGGVLGAIMAPPITRRIGLGRTMVLGLFVMGSGLFAVMFTKYGLLAVALQVGWAVGISVINVPLATIRQHYSSEAMLGRVITASRAIGWATLPFGALLGGWLGNSPDSYPRVARAFPLLLIAAGVWLMSTVVWKDTFGHGSEGESVDQASV
jgi:MFS family permease